jgi:hypothetical protein
MDKQKIMLKKGQILGVGVREKIRDVLSYVEHHGQVWIKALSKENIGGGRTLWKFDAKCRGKKAPPPTPRMDKSSDDIPF